MAINSVYIMTNRWNTVLYTGVTDNLPRRVWEHRHGLGGAFTRKYRCYKLVSYELFGDVRLAIAREKQIKGGSQKKKGQLVEGLNPDWLDLADQLRIRS